MSVNEIVYVRLCSELFKNKEDFTDKVKLKAHNSAMAKLHKKCLELKNNIAYATEFFTRLMQNNDERVRMTAAAHCLLLLLPRLNIGLFHGIFRIFRVEISPDFRWLQLPFAILVLLYWR